MMDRTCRRHLCREEALKAKGNTPVYFVIRMLSVYVGGANEENYNTEQQM